MSFQSPMLKYLREILDEHTILIEGMQGGVIEAIWLVVLIHNVEEVYRKNGLL